MKKWPKIYYEKVAVECPFTVPKEKAKRNGKQKVQDEVEEGEVDQDDPSVAEKR